MGAWYYKKGSVDIGPLSDKELVQAYLSGALTPSSPIKKEGMEKWMPFNKLKNYEHINNKRLETSLNPDSGYEGAAYKDAKPGDFTNTTSPPDNGRAKNYEQTNNKRLDTALYPDRRSEGSNYRDAKPGYYSNTKFLSDDDGLDDEINLAEYWQIISRHKWGIVGMVFACTLIGALTAFSIKSSYRANVTMLVEPEQPKIVSLDPMSNANNIKFFYETQNDIIRSRTVAEAVIYTLKLYDNPEFTDEGSSPLVFNWREWVPELLAEYLLEWGAFSAPPEQSQISEEVKAAIEFRRGRPFSANIEQGDRAILLSLPAQAAQAKLMKIFQDRLSIGGEENSQIVSIKFDSYNPQLAADIANAIASAYMNLGLESRLSVVKQATSWLTSRLVDLRQKLAISEQALQDFQVREGVIDTKSRQDIVSKRLSGITEQLVRSQATLIEAEIRYNQVLQIDRSGKSYDSLRPVLEHILIQTLKEEEARLVRQSGELAERYGEKHPKIIAVKSDMKEAKAHLKLEIGKVVEGIHKEYEVARENVRRLRILSEKIKFKMRKNTGREYKLAKLERDVATNRQLYDIFLTRSKETNVAGNTDVTNVRIIDQAQPPVEPVKPKKALITILSMFAGLIMGVSLAFVREHLDNTFKTPDDVERDLHLPVLGSVPLMSNSDMERFLAKREILSKVLEPFTEMIRNIRTSILFSDLDHPPKTILVTSSVPAEGKTTLSCSIALSFSQIGRTLLIEADLRKPAQAKMMRLKDSPGLADVISGQVTIKQAIIKDYDNDNMSFLAGKASSSSPLEVLSSRKFRSMLDELKTQFDYIIIDTAPAVLFSDALVISHLVDCSLMVVKADATTRSMAKDALKRFKAIHLKPVGVVLTHVNMREIGSYGHAYYNYGSYINNDSE